MEYKRESVLITSQVKITSDIYRISFQSVTMAQNGKPGQFVTVYCRDGSRLLPRPFGISEIDKEKNEVSFVYKVVGGGTEEFTTYRPGEFMEVMGPLGNGFSLDGKKALLVGGGTGIPILLELAKQIKQTTGREAVTVVGFRDETYLTAELSKYSRVLVATEDGSKGTKGNVLDVINQSGLEADVVYACGPHPMLRALKNHFGPLQVELQISMEEKMACGIGACLACTCKSRETDPYTKVHNKRICKEGPVFDSNEVLL
ncbi:dihydroorotate dehydrogenase electron transfer subunit [Parasporobacterium paucivorans]|uniref:Dihydroorotate dehydrogenase B (NAD(+)), electron transfer subunit n=1 Tax=Parasporobacterium paucivorans DSM 15970 TaxID=1122934 RepID=A0A1M6HIZ5_9FIRM|nr:dihydroorotate dehydrogenase electron transfer subunit [Parasporobacterium paucivorans]SHJ22119.1 dihydroorotate dehydrogenase electron transfer subunit [Parasporobacterium paucivorans DSM 15970]